MERDATEPRHVVRQGAFALRPAVDVIEDAAGQSPLGDPTQVVDAGGSPEPAGHGVELELSKLEDGSQRVEHGVPSVPRAARHVLVGGADPGHTACRMPVPPSDAHRGSSPRVLLVHGAGNTSRVWRRVQDRLRHESHAVDLPGRGRRPSDITDWTVADAGRQLADEAREVLGGGPILVVAHSAGAIVAPSLLAHLGADAAHVVFVAGLIAPDGSRPADIVHPERVGAMADRRVLLLRERRGSTFVEAGVDPPPGLAPITDPAVVQGIDSLNLMFQTVTWSGVPDHIGRTYIRCRQDEIQCPAMQDRLIAASGATEVIEIDTGHTPAREDPERLAAIVDTLAARCQR